MNEAEPPSPVAEKAGGLVLLAAAAAMVKVGVLDPIQSTAVGASVEPVVRKGIVLAPLCFVLGVALLALPHNTVWRFLSHPSLRNPDTERITARGAALIVATLLPGLALYLWLEAHLAALALRA